MPAAYTRRHNFDLRAVDFYRNSFCRGVRPEFLTHVWIRR